MNDKQQVVYCVFRNGRLVKIFRTMDDAGRYTLDEQDRLKFLHRFTQFETTLWPIEEY